MTKTDTKKPMTAQQADRMAPPLLPTREVLRRCRAERLGHRFAENMF